MSTALVAALLKPQPKHYYGGVLFDEGVRDAIGLRSLQDRYTARDVSDVSLAMLVTAPFFVDALVTAWWYRGSSDVAREMALIDAKTLAVVAALQGATNGLASRERPYGRECGTALPGDLSDCTGNVRYRSFFSGHAAFSFASAGLVCSHHLRLGLLGGRADTFACVSAALAAGATASLRVLGDMHYASDVLTGALVGTAAGLGIPALHYGGRKPQLTSSGGAGGVQITVVPMSLGAGLVGAF
jgi:membrane-associated phospholipid phosphatase